MLRLPILLFTLFPLTVSAQHFSLGVQGGVPAQTPLGRSDQIPFSIGPTVEFHILGGLSLQSGLLYDRIGRRSDQLIFLGPENGLTLGSANVRGSALEIPVLAKYRFRSGRSGIRPFLAAGPTVRRTATRSDWFTSILSGSSLTPVSNPGLLNQRITRWNVDPAVAAGIDFRTGRFHLEPQVQYSYWGAGVNGAVRKNQVNFLMGFRF